MGFKHCGDCQKSQCQNGTFKEDFKFWGSNPGSENKYVLFIKSLLEQSATLWHSSLTKENEEYLERLQKNVFGNILQDKYENRMNIHDMEKLRNRREELCLSFALKCLNNPKTANMFPGNEKTHQMETRDPEKFEVQHDNNERLNNSAIIYMQNLLNVHEKNQGQK